MLRFEPLVVVEEQLSLDFFRELIQNINYFQGKLPTSQ